MKITAVHLYTMKIPLLTPFKTALRTVENMENVVVTLETDEGALGFGEAPPTAVITGDTIPPSRAPSATSSRPRSSAAR